jgi:hypothetical protein
MWKFCYVTVLVYCALQAIRQIHECKMEIFCRIHILWQKLETLELIIACLGWISLVANIAGSICICRMWIFNLRISAFHRKLFSSAPPGKKLSPDYYNL